jgi:predicted RNA binding protein YcfA (HicA-like mRNA interferase family)
MEQRGSHLKLRKGNQTIIVPMHRRDVRRGTLASILDDAGISVDRFRELL